MKAFLETIIENLVDHPEEINISELNGQNTIIYEIKVARDDMGKIIGKQGKTAYAIRLLLNAVSRKKGKITQMEIVDDNPQDYLAKKAV